jgi:hypothetical protein
MLSKKKEFIKRALNGSTFLNNQKTKVPIDIEFTCTDIKSNEYKIESYSCTSDLSNEIRKDLVNSGFNHVQVHKLRFDYKYMLEFFVIGTKYSFEFAGKYTKRHVDFIVVDKLDFEKNESYTKKEMIEILCRENFYNLFSYLPKVVKENDNPKLEEYKKLQQRYFDESKMYDKTDQYPERTRLKNTLHKIARNFSSIEDYYDNEELVKLDSELSATKDLFMSKSEYIW